MNIISSDSLISLPSLYAQKRNTPWICYLVDYNNYHHTNFNFRLNFIQYRYRIASSMQLLQYNPYRLITLT